MIMFNRKLSDFLLLRLYKNGQYSKVIINKNSKVFYPVSSKTVKVSKIKKDDILGTGYSVVEKIKLLNSSMTKNLQKNIIYKVPDLSEALQELDDIAVDGIWEPPESLLKKYYIEEISKFMLGVKIKTIFGEELYLSGELLKAPSYFYNFDELFATNNFETLDSL